MSTHQTPEAARSWTRLERSLIKPHPSIQDPDEHWRAGVLLALLIPLTIVTLVGATAMWLTSHAPPWAHIVSTAMLLCALVLGRTRLAAWGATLAVLGFAEPTFWISFVKQYSRPEDVTMGLVWMAEATVVSVLVLPVVRSILVNLGLIVALCVLFGTIQPHPEVRLFPPLSFLAVFTMLAGVSSVILHRSRQGLHAEIKVRKRAEEALQSANEQLEERVQRRTDELRRINDALSAVVSSSPAAVIMLNLEGIVEMWNQAATNIFGWTTDEIVGRPNPIVPMSAESRPSQPFGVGERDLPQLGLELTVRAKDGRNVDILLSTAPLRDTESRSIGVVGVALDLTQQRSLEAQFRHAQKMEAIGRLASGVAHDFNNLLTVINGGAAMLCDQFPDGSDEKLAAAEVLGAGQRAGALTRQLLAFSRKQATHKENIDLKEMVESLSKMIRRLIGPDIELMLHLSPGLHSVEADRGQLEQVLMNLVVNAADAMPDGGTMTIKCENGAYERVALRERAAPSIPRAVAISVIDTGTGMLDEIREKIFEPFFTTKEQGKGTGLGLATVFGIVANHGGALEVESEYGKGTTIRIYLPSNEVSTTQKNLETLDKLSGHETVLVIEDVTSVRVLTGRMLERLGYQPLLASGWDEAKTIYLENPERIDLVLSDVVMPGVSGPECVRRLREIRTDQPVLFMSGRAERAGQMFLDDDDSPPLLDKPFDMAKLARALSAVLPKDAHSIKKS